jgi:pimeloyl-ACP methyl ester carboxylesterase
VDWLYLSLIILAIAAGVVVVAFGIFLFTLLRLYLPIVVRIFEEKPFFRPRRDNPIAEAEEFRIPTPDGLTLAACLVRSRSSEKKGLILFAPEYGGSRWSCTHYAGHLLDEGYDVFAFDFRNQGDSDHLEGYQPLQWVTQHEVTDLKAVMNFLKDAPFCPTDGIGFFGISRGGSTGMVVCAGDPFVHCLTTDGAFGTVATMIRFMLRWVKIYSSPSNRPASRSLLVNLVRKYVPTQAMILKLVPLWFYGLLAIMALRDINRRKGIYFPSVRRALRRLRQQLFMIHGGADGYIVPDISRDLHQAAPHAFCKLWLVEGAKHNQAVDIAEEEYQLSTSTFFLNQYQVVPVPQSSPALDLDAELAAGPEFSPA